MAFYHLLDTIEKYYSAFEDTKQIFIVVGAVVFFVVFVTVVADIFWAFCKGLSFFSRTVVTLARVLVYRVGRKQPANVGPSGENGRAEHDGGPRRAFNIRHSRSQHGGPTSRRNRPRVPRSKRLTKINRREARFKANARQMLAMFKHVELEICTIMAGIHQVVDHAEQIRTSRTGYVNRPVREVENSEAMNAATETVIEPLEPNGDLDDIADMVNAALDVIRRDRRENEEAKTARDLVPEDF
ncbi:hypothetical protein HGRIS_003999 [Hohenbuehelia grisea]|uniref:Uncharacterized protein n=1 Tax=Hohenbuehelia grisea TaxID=104357 RepID=A0ABR3JI59_9AGAR